MSTITTKDGTRIFYKDFGSGQPVVFSHGWPLMSAAWDPQIFFLASNGYRCIAHDRRGHGRSDQTWHGNEMDTYADDLAELFEALDLKDVIMIGYSTAGGGGGAVHWATRDQARRYLADRCAVLPRYRERPVLRLQSAGRAGIAGVIHLWVNQGTMSGYKAPTTAKAFSETTSPRI